MVTHQMKNLLFIYNPPVSVSTLLLLLFNFFNQLLLFLLNREICYLACLFNYAVLCGRFTLAIGGLFAIIT